MGMFLTSQVTINFLRQVMDHEICAYDIYRNTITVVIGKVVIESYELL
jgi:predicted SprT family Zn-dependent metalloprotease